jgi:hypothetical protein
VFLNGFMPDPGQTFTFLFYDSRNGQFDRIKNVNFDDMHWEIEYVDEDRMAILKVVGGRLPGVPDQASTLVLLMLGLLGLVMCRALSARKQS